MERLVGAALAVLAMCSASPAANAAETPASAPLWHCWYGDHPQHVTCFKPQLPMSTDTGADDIGDLAHELAHALMAEGDHAAVTRVIRRFPESFRGVTVLIPLHTIPFNMESVEQLANAVICPRRACTVAFDNTGVSFNVSGARKPFAAY